MNTTASLSQSIESGEFVEDFAVLTTLSYTADLHCGLLSSYLLYSQIAR